MCILTYFKFLVLETLNHHQNFPLLVNDSFKSAKGEKNIKKTGCVFILIRQLLKIGGSENESGWTESCPEQPLIRVDLLIPPFIS